MAAASDDNGRKARRGSNAQKSLESLIGQLTDYGAISESEFKPSYGYEGLDPKQFDAHAEVTLANGERVILFTTSSLRSDRLEEHQWRAYNIKAIDEEIERSFVVLPDESAFDKGTGPRDKIRNKSHYSAIDDVVTASELYNLFSAEYTSEMGTGKRNDLEGRKFEELFASALNSHANLERFNGSVEAVGEQYDLFRQILHDVGFSGGDIVSIEATTDIPPLQSGGKPKTDVAAKFLLKDGEERWIKFSLKNTSKSTVSVHEYSADVFAEVLDSSNEELRRLLNAFQTAGNLRDMDPNDFEKLSIELSPYIEKMNKWVFSGEGPENVTEIQVADFIVVNDKNTQRMEIHDVGTYIQLQEEKFGKSGRFGTVFRWTFPSKKRGKRIQLKAHVIQEHLDD